MVACIISAGAWGKLWHPDSGVTGAPAAALKTHFAIRQLFAMATAKAWRRWLLFLQSAIKSGNRFADLKFCERNLPLGILPQYTGIELMGSSLDKAKVREVIDV